MVIIPLWGLYFYGGYNGKDPKLKPADIRMVMLICMSAVCRTRACVETAWDLVYLLLMMIRLKLFQDIFFAMVSGEFLFQSVSDD